MAQHVVEEPSASSRAIRVFGRAFAYVIVTLGAVVMVAPFLWMLSTSLKGGGAIFEYPPRWIPDPITFDNFREFWTVVDFDRYLFNSLFVAVCIGLPIPSISQLNLSANCST